MAIGCEVGCWVGDRDERLDVDGARNAKDSW
jgi:hypothetical protein